jgi:hypothetical protein
VVNKHHLCAKLGCFVDCVLAGVYSDHQVLNLFGTLHLQAVYS